jgi:hypothetical protein
MAYTVPSQVCDLIALLFPEQYQRQFAREAQYHFNSGYVRAVLDAFAKVPENLITLPAPEATMLSANISAMQMAIDDHVRGQSTDLITLPGSTLLPFGEVYRLLAKCPDEAAAPATAGLEFVTDIQLRDVLRTDISTAVSALTNHEYKAATVLAGSVVEALLFWALDKFGIAAVRLRAPRAPQESVDAWGLGWLINAARDCDLIGKDTAQQASLAKDYRNLIHPGVQSRLQDKCDRGTAYGALAAVERVAVDLAGRFPQP